MTGMPRTAWFSSATYYGFYNAAQLWAALLVFSCKLFFHPPSIRPTSSKSSTKEAYVLWSTISSCQAICKKNLRRSHFAIACETNDSFSNLSHANVARNIVSKSVVKISSILSPIVYRSIRLKFMRLSCHA